MSVSKNIPSEIHSAFHLHVEKNKHLIISDGLQPTSNGLQPKNIQEINPCLHSLCQTTNLQGLPSVTTSAVMGCRSQWTDYFQEFASAAGKVKEPPEAAAVMRYFVIPSINNVRQLNSGNLGCPQISVETVWDTFLLLSNNILTPSSNDLQPTSDGLQPISNFNISWQHDSQLSRWHKTYISTEDAWMILVRTCGHSQLCMNSSKHGLVNAIRLVKLSNSKGVWADMYKIRRNSRSLTSQQRVWTRRGEGPCLTKWSLVCFCFLVFIWERLLPDRVWYSFGKTKNIKYIGLCCY